MYGSVVSATGIISAELPMQGSDVDVCALNPLQMGIGNLAAENIKRGKKLLMARFVLLCRNFGLFTFALYYVGAYRIAFL